MGSFCDVQPVYKFYKWGGDGDKYYKGEEKCEKIEGEEEGGEEGGTDRRRGRGRKEEGARKEKGGWRGDKGPFLFLFFCLLVLGPRSSI